jgi:drug/metabolite transporter (DMT)-like permease
MLPVRERTGHIAQVVSVCAFSVGIMVQKGLAARYSAADVVALQFVAAAALMWCVCALWGYLPRRASEALPGLAWGCLTPGLVFLFASAGAQRTDGVSVALIWGLMPLIGPLLGRLLLGERFHWSLPFGASISFCGLVVLTLERQAIGSGTIPGDLLVLAGVLSAASGQIIGRRLNTSGAPWLRMATLQITGAAAISLVVAHLDGVWMVPPLEDSEAYGSLAYLVLGMTMANFIGYNLALSRIQVAWIAFYNSLSPAIGSLTAVLLLGEVVRPLDMAGIAVIVSGVAIPHAMRIRRARRGAEAAS